MVNAHPHGASFLAKTARISIELEDGSCQSYILKVSQNYIGEAVALSESDSTSAIRKYVPGFVPRSARWGQDKSDINVYFYA